MLRAHKNNYPSVTDNTINIQDHITNFSDDNENYIGDNDALQESSMWFNSDCIGFKLSDRRSRLSTLSHGSSPAKAIQDEIKIPKVIHFIHYNAKVGESNFLCSIEAAISHNPFHKVIIHAGNKEDMEHVLSSILKTNPLILSRVQVQSIDYDLSFQDTPFWEWYKNENNPTYYRQSNWIDQNLSNALRLALLWKYGGVYLDMDIILIKPVDIVGRALTQEAGFMINNAALSFPGNDIYIWKAMEKFVKEFNGYEWGHNGPHCLTHTYFDLCLPKKKINTHFNTSDGIYPELEPDSFNEKACKGLQVSSPKQFYPIYFTKSYIYQEPAISHCLDLKNAAKSSVGIHWWHKALKNKQVHSNSVLGYIFATQCPNLVREIGWETLGFNSTV